MAAARSAAQTTPVSAAHQDASVARRADTGKEYPHQPRATRSLRVAAAAALLHLHAGQLPARPRLGGELVPLALHLVLGRPLAPGDAIELVADLPSGAARRDEDDHDD